MSDTGRLWNGEGNGKITVAVVGLGLMGSSISSCLLAAGHPVIGVDHLEAARRRLPSKVESDLQELLREGFPLDDAPDQLMSRLQVSADPADLAECPLIVETISEDPAVKKQLFAQLDAIVRPNAVIASNTSAIPISQLQQGTAHPARILGMHWAEPAHITRFLEIVCGTQSDPVLADQLMALSRSWGKQPALVRRDVRGFIANRIMYAILREACHLVESGVADVEDIDRCVSQDLGSWTALTGPFRYMDLTGVKAYAAVMEELFPELSNAADVPRIMQQRAEARPGSQNFYAYTPESTEQWRRLFERFSYDVRKLSDRYQREIEALEGEQESRPEKGRQA